MSSKISKRSENSTWTEEFFQHFLYKKEEFQITYHSSLRITIDKDEIIRIKVSTTFTDSIRQSMVQRAIYLQLQTIIYANNSLDINYNLGVKLST